MEIHDFFNRLENCVARYDLLRHPFYQAWSCGELTNDDLQHYAGEYYRQIESFPRCLAQLARRLPPSELRTALLANLSDEVGGYSKRSHAEVWLDFAEGIGAGRGPFLRPPCPGVRELISFFHKVATESTPEEALAVFYVYESQVPRISREKVRALQIMYGAGERTCQYFLLHMEADVHHTRVWKQQLEKCLRRNPGMMESAVRAAEAAGRALWEALTSIERICLARAMDA